MTSPLAVIAIPVRNEARRLPRLITALSRQDIFPSLFAAAFLFDGCSDESEAVLETSRAGLGFQTFAARLPPAPPNAGRARRAACQHALNSAPNAPCLLTTDADTIPSPDWIRRNLAALDQADVVAGRIEREKAEDLPLRCRQEVYCERLHRLRRYIDPIEYDPYPSHPSLGGASLAFRLGCYNSLGGFPPLVSGEDTALVTAARLQGWRVRHDRNVHVITSARTLGRAPGGLAGELALFPRSAGELLVDDPVAAVRYYQLQNCLRRSFADGGLVLPLSELGVEASPARLARLRKAASGPDAFVEAVSSLAGSLPRLPLCRAERKLAPLEASLLPAAEAA